MGMDFGFLRLIVGLILAFYVIKLLRIGIAWALLELG